MMEVAVSSEALALAYTASHSIAAIFEVRFMFMRVIYLGQQHTGCNCKADHYLPLLWSHSFKAQSLLVFSMCINNWNSMSDLILS